MSSEMKGMSTPDLLIYSDELEEKYDSEVIKLGPSPLSKVPQWLVKSFFDGELKGTNHWKQEDQVLTALQSGLKWTRKRDDLSNRFVSQLRLINKELKRRIRAS